MRAKKCIAMVLAGGRETRLGTLTGKNFAVSAMHFGGKYRIIDFVLSNCKHSGINTLGILTQHKYSALHEYVDKGQAWGLNSNDGGVYMLSSCKNGVYYTGTADAVYKNMDFIEHFNPEHILILPGDHVYKMDYAKMLAFHQKKHAGVTVAATRVPWEEALRFGVITAGEDGLISEFAEKSPQPQSNFVSMGIYIFKWEELKKFLIADKNNIMSQNDFGKNIIPDMLAAGIQLYAYQFDNYWKDIGTIQSFWEANMDLLKESPKLNLYDEKWEVLTKSPRRPPCYISAPADVKKSIVSAGCKIYGKVENSILFDSVYVSTDTEIIDSIIMPGAIINKNARIYKTIVGPNASVGENVEIGANRGIYIFYDSKLCSKDISLISPGIYIDENIKITRNSHINRNLSIHERQEIAMRRELDINKAMANLEIMYV